MSAQEVDEVEPIEDFRARAREWLDGGALPPRSQRTFSRDDERWQEERVLQARLWEGGFAGICFPVAYGGLGLTHDHQRAFDELTIGYDMPFGFNVPTLGILAATLLDFGTEAQKLRHVPAILQGEELWVQMLSEPSGGSDLAGVLTRADRDGDVFVLNGSKIWSSGADAADFAMILARTDWDVPKHRGLSMFILPIRQPGVTVERIRQVDGTMEFCQEFFDDVHIPVDDVVGTVDDGWTVASRLLVHERLSVGGGSPFTSGRARGHDASAKDGPTFEDLVRAQGRSSDPRARALVAEAHVRQTVGGHLVKRITQAMARGAMPPPAGSMMKLFAATNHQRRVEIGLELAGWEAAVWPTDAPSHAGELGQVSLARQGIALGGGSNEIQRNIISERLLGMPREHAADREIPYREVKRGPSGADR